MPAEHDSHDPADHDACAASEGGEPCEACEDAEDIRIARERLRTEDTIPWECIKAKYGL